MDNFLLLLLSCFVQCILIRNATAQIVPCESVVIYNFGLNTGKPKTCMMSGSTAIAAVGSRTETNTAVGALWMFGNKKIEYLPENIDVTLPNLIGINAANCALKAISKANFKNLLKLKNLMLEDNRIETIEGATFQDLKALITLNLGNNKIKFMSGHAFDGLKQLISVSLHGNICIDQQFLNKKQITTMSIILDASCGFDAELLEIENLQMQKVKLQLENQKLSVEMENLRLDKESQRMDKEKIQVEKLIIQKEKEVCQLDKETYRMNQEKCRVDKEKCRVDLELCQVDGKTCRSSEEICRLNVESSRLDNESCQLDKNKFRLDTESCRLDHEAVRLEQEVCRMEKETIRIDQKACQSELDLANNKKAEAETIAASMKTQTEQVQNEVQDLLSELQMKLDVIKESLQR